MRAIINKLVEYEEGIAMATEVLLEISRDEVERARLLSELKYQLDMQSEMTYAREEGLAEGRNEVLGLIEKGYTLEDIRRELANR